MYIKETLFDKALRNYNFAIDGYRIDKENYNNLISYHLQQSVELSLKYILEVNAKEYPYVHNINQLILKCELEKVNFEIPKFIKENAFDITNWETESRYEIGYYVDDLKLEEAIDEIGNFLELIKSRIQNN